MVEPAYIFALTERAVLAGQLESLLLGESEYACFSRRSPHGLKTNPVLILRDGIYLYDRIHPEAGLRAKLEACLDRWQDYILGQVTAALILCVEARFARDNRHHLGISLARHCDALRESIRRNRPALRQVKEFGGKDFPDGVLGYLRHLSIFSERQGGPAFFPYEVKIALRPTSSRPPFGHLEPIVETLLASGNKRSHPESFLPDRYHWTCFFKRPIDFDLIRRAFDLPPNITLEEGQGSIFDSQGFIEITGGRDIETKPPAWSETRYQLR